MSDCRNTYSHAPMFFHGTAAATTFVRRLLRTLFSASGCLVAAADESVQNDGGCHLGAGAPKAEPKFDRYSSGCLILLCKAFCDDLVGLARDRKRDQSQVYRPRAVELPLLLREPSSLQKTLEIHTWNLADMVCLTGVLTDCKCAVCDTELVSRYSSLRSSPHK